MPGPQITAEQRKKLAELLKGLSPPDPNSLTEEERLKAFKRLMEPESSPTKMNLGNDESGQPINTEVTLPPHPYPFKNPVTMTRDIDNAVRELRGLAPGAGTAKTNIISNKPPIIDIARQTAPDLKDKLLKGLVNPENITIGGMAITKPDKPGISRDNEVYIRNQPSWSLGNVVSHELSHRNIPSTDDDNGDDGLEWKPSAYYAGKLYDSLKKKR